MSKRGLFLIVLAGLCIKPANVLAAPAIGGVSSSGNTAKYEKFEVTFQVQNSVATNFQWPYETAPAGAVERRIPYGKGISVDAIFTDPNNNSYSQPAFYYQPYQYQQIGSSDWFYPDAPAVWMVRFAPNKEGSWKFKLKATDASGTVTTADQTFTVAASGNHGFVRVSKQDSRYFTFDDGTYFPGLGFNMNFNLLDWVNPVSANQANLTNMGQNGVQLIRIWMSQWSIFGAKWNAWRCIMPGCDAAWPEVYPDQSYLDHDVAIAMYPAYAAVMTTGQWPGTYFSPPVAVKPNTTYRVRVRAKTVGMTTAVNQSHANEFGLVAKITDNGISWCDTCNQWGVGKTVTNYINNVNGANPDWVEAVGTYTSGSINFLNSISVTVSNAANGAAYVDQIVMEEDNHNGTYGPNILAASAANHHMYVDQAMSARFDKVVELAQTNGVYLKPVVMEWGDDIMDRIGFDGNTVTNPDPGNFYGDGRNMTRVRWFQQMWWRYLQARWGYSTAIQSWEMVNEGNPNGDDFTMADEFGKYMKCRVFGIDPGVGDGKKCTYIQPDFHLTSTSFWSDYPKAGFWENPSYPNMDFADIHRYGFRGGGDNYLNVDGVSYPLAVNNTSFNDTALFTQEFSTTVKARNPKMPVFRGETGIVENNNTDSVTSALDGDVFGTGTNQGQGVWLHNFVWGQINPGGVIEEYWYSNYSGRDIYGQKDQRGQFKPYYLFIKDLPLANGNYVDAAAVTTNGLRAWGQKDLANKRAHVWIQNPNHQWGNYAPAAMSGTITVGGFTANASYAVEWWNTYTGAVSSTQTVTANSSGNLVLSVSNLITDTAVKIGSTTNTAPTPTAIPTSVPSPSVRPTSTPTPVPGDANGDNHIDGLDYVIWLNNYGTGVSGVAKGDFNIDNKVDGLDYVIWLNNYGK